MIVVRVMWWCDVDGDDSGGDSWVMGLTMVLLMMVVMMMVIDDDGS